MIKKIINAISIINRKIKYKKYSYSFNAVDIVVDYIFKNNKSGFYLDVGAQHPISNNNTYLLYKKGWNGINIDLDKKNIELFNIARPGDINLNYAVSNKNTTENLYFYHDKSPINTLNHKVHNFQDAKVKSIKKIQTQTLDNIFKEIKFDKKIDYMNIDVEGHEEKVLEGFDIKNINQA